MPIKSTTVEIYWISVVQSIASKTKASLLHKPYYTWHSIDSSYNPQSEDLPVGLQIRLSMLMLEQLSGQQYFDPEVAQCLRIK